MQCRLPRLRASVNDMAATLSTLTHLLEIVPFLLEAPGALRLALSLLWSVLLAEGRNEEQPPDGHAPVFTTSPSGSFSDSILPPLPHQTSPDPELCLA